LFRAITAPLYDTTITATYPSNNNVVVMSFSFLVPYIPLKGVLKRVLAYLLFTSVSMLRDPLHPLLTVFVNPSFSRDRLYRQ